MNLSEIFLNNGLLSPQLILWMFYIAVVIGTVFYHLINVQMSSFISKLLEADATTPEKAASLGDLNVHLGFILKMCLHSPMYYKDMLVAITADGKYYANHLYTDEPPTFRTLRAITRIKKSRVKDKNSSATTSEEQKLSVITQTTEAEDEILTTAAKNIDATPQRVNFHPLSAKYYIPIEVHDKVNNIYKKPKTKLIYVILLLLGMAVLTFLAGIAIDFIMDSLPNLLK